MKRFLFLLALGAMGAIFFRTFLIEGIYLASDSMAPTLKKGTHVFVNKAALFFRKPRRGEIVMFETPQEPDKGLVKRVIALEGDTIAIRNKVVYLNNFLLEESYVQHLRPRDILKGDNFPPIEIPADHVFVMGDNRDFSGDSRDWQTPEGEWVPYVPIAMVRGVISEP